MKPVIGILGGMGPRATVVFEQLLIANFKGSDQDIPTIITINDGGIPDRSRYITGCGPDPVPRLQRNLDMLERMGATIICLPCNTAAASSIGGRLTTSTSRLLDLPGLTGDAVAAAGVRRLYILGTTGTIKARTYQDICRLRGISCLVPDARTQRLVDKLIGAIKRQQRPAARSLARRLSEAIGRSGCDSVLLGCTELPLLKSEIAPPDCRIFDTIAILAGACVRYSQPNRQGVPV